MSLYATLNDIRENCSSIENIANGTDAQLTMWGSEAAIRINMWCGQSFDFEDQTVKTVYGSYHPSVFLPKRMHGAVAMTVTEHGGSPLAVPADDIEVQDGGLYFRYLPNNRELPSTQQLKFTITADWGYEVLPEEIVLAFYKITSRIALRDNIEDLRYHNSGFTSESWSDGYSYSLSDAELRSLIHPNDAVLLWNHQNTGRTAA